MIMIALISLVLCLVFIPSFLVRCSPAELTALDEYISLPDPNYHWSERVDERIVESAYTLYVINMTSQAWLTADEFVGSGSPCHIWWHDLIIVVPKQLNPSFSTVAAMYIQGGSIDNGDYRGRKQVKATIDWALQYGMLGVSLFQVPQEPCQFTRDPLGMQRDEDAIIAFGWAQFLRNTSQSHWLPRLPMVKAVVRALDTITAFGGSLSPAVSVAQFITMGESKRGWTTWLTGVVDERIIGQVPMMMSALNLQANLHHYWRSFGGWSDQFVDYYNESIMAHLDSPQIQLMADIIDPYSYCSRLARLPIYNIESSGDEFFMQDDAHYWRAKCFPFAQGNFHQRMMPNCEHEMFPPPCRQEAMDGIRGWLENVITAAPLPQFQWTIANVTGEIHVTPQTGKLVNVTRWLGQTVLTTRRDFRLFIMGPQGPEGQQLPQNITWTPTPVQPNPDGSYTASAPMPPPGTGWTAFWLELTYANPSGQLNKFSTDVSIIPQEFPFPDCHGKECLGTMM